MAGNSLVPEATAMMPRSEFSIQATIVTNHPTLKNVSTIIILPIDRANSLNR
jgi:hypothetical protein